MTARSLPCALCTTCHAYHYDSSVIGTRCDNRDADGKLCTGSWQNRLRFTDWVACPHCKGSGYLMGKRCLPCKNSGWLAAR